MIIFVKLGSFANPAVPVLLKSLSDSNDNIRKAAVQALIQIGPAAIPLLLQTITNSDPKLAESRVELAQALINLPTQTKIIQSLITALQDPDEYVRVHMIKALGEFGVDADEAVVPIIALLKDDKINVKRESIIALGNISRQGNIVVPQIMNFLTDKDASFRAAAALALGRFGVDASPALT